MIIVFMDVFYNFFDLLSVNRILYKGTKQGMLYPYILLWA